MTMTNVTTSVSATAMKVDSSHRRHQPHLLISWPSTVETLQVRVSKTI